MVLRMWTALVKACVVMAVVVSAPWAGAFDQLWVGTEGDWNTPTNWEFGVPRQSLQDQAVIGALAPGTETGGIANLSGNTFVVGGTVLGRDPGTDGTLNLLPGANLTNQPVSGITSGAVTVGAGGRGYLNMTGGTLSAVGLTLGGEQIDPVSSINLSGSSTVNINDTVGLVTLNGNVRITGPNVNFNTNRPVTLQSNNTITAEITAGTHSPIKTAGNLTLGGTLQVEFNGVNPTPGDAWDLFDFGGGLSGSFSNVPAGADVVVSGAPEPALGSAYRLRRDTGGTNGNLLQIALQELLVLQVNRDTGELAITNPFGGDIAIDGYTIESRTAGSLLPSYKGISGAPAANPNWFKPAVGDCDGPGNSPCALAEFKDDGTNNSVFDLSSIPSVPLGTGFDKFAVANNVQGIGTSGEDLVFHYTYPGAEGGRVRGHVEYVGTPFHQNLILRVNPTTGEASIKNDSSYTLTFDGYSVLSNTGNLNGANWDGLGGTWEQSPASSMSLTETNLFGALTLEPGEEESIGDISATGFATPAAQNGLSFQFILAESLGPGSGDYNDDGVVNAADYVVWRNNEGQNVTLPNENPDAATPGVVDQEDYDHWVAQFGSTGGPETEFRIGNVFFDPTAGSGSGRGSLAVPEPASGMLLVMGLGAALLARRKRQRQEPSLSKSIFRRAHSPHHGQTGVANMSRHTSRILGAVVGAWAATMQLLPAAAVTQGIPLINQDFNLPGGGKVVPFDETGAFIPDQIPGWIFSGPGMETRFNPTDPDTMQFLYIGDSSVEAGGGYDGTHLTLSTLDATVYQTSTHNITNIPNTQAYRVSFLASDAFTISAGESFEQFTDRAELTAWLYYENVGGMRVPLATESFNLVGGIQDYTVEIAGGSPALAAAVGRPIGVEFDTTSIEFNQGTEFAVAHSWVAVDDVILEIAGVLDGDINGDGQINAADYGVVRDNQQTASDYMADGELTRDGLVNLDDFREFKRIFDAQPGAAAGEGNVVPEPSAVALLLVALSSVAGLRSARSVRMRRLRQVSFLLALCSTAVLATGNAAHAELLYYDPFLVGANPAAGEYALGPIVGQNPTNGPTPFFTGAWTQGGFAGDPPEQAVIEDSLSYLGTTGLGGAVQGVGRVGRFLNNATEWTDTTEGTFYISFMAQYGTAADPQGTGTGDGNLGFRTTEFWPFGNEMQTDTGRSEVGFQGFAGDANQQIPATAVLRWVPGGGNTAPHFLTDIPFNDFNTTHLIVMKFELSAEPGGDTISVQLDPTVAEEPETYAQTETGLNYTLNAMSTISFFGNAAGQSPIFDELRVGTTYSSVLPDLPCAGDTDGNCVIDLDDFNTIAANFNRTDANGPAQGDVAGINGRLGTDGRVDLRDYRLWRDNRTDVGAGGGTLADLFGTAVPEPTGGLLATLAGLVLTVMRRRTQ